MKLERIESQKIRWPQPHQRRKRLRGHRRHATQTTACRAQGRPVLEAAEVGSTDATPLSELGITKDQSCLQHRR
jgi:hypothetical protein